MATYYQDTNTLLVMVLYKKPVDCQSFVKIMAVLDKESEDHDSLLDLSSEEHDRRYRFYVCSRCFRLEQNGERLTNRLSFSSLEQNNE